MINAVILAVVEGATEYLPISSTGHIILASTFLGIATEPFVKDYTVIVQFGAILAVLVLYWRRFFQSFDIYLKLFVAFLPAAILGLLVKDHIDQILGSVEIVAWSLIIGGLILIPTDKWQVTNNSTELSYRQVLIIGLAQCLAFIPGVSRAGAAIVGALAQGIDRKTAAEFSFLLAVPTLSGAAFIKTLKILPTITSEHVNIIVIGNIVSFVVGWLTIKVFIHYLTKFGFKEFGWYRITVGGILLILIYSGVSLNMM